MAASNTRSPWPSVAKLIGVLLVTALLCTAVVLPYVGGLGLAARHEAAKFLATTCNLTESAPPEASTIYASDGATVIARIFTQDRQPVPLSHIPTYLRDALLATEDRRFYQHHGVDMRGLIRSAFSTSGGDTQGGSTLTMQYVKQVRYYNDIGNLKAQQNDISQNLDRKMEDAKCALQLEKRESKDTILDNYLDIAFFGENAYSIESAARTYFDKDVQNLTLPESAMLVGLLKAPTEYDPFEHPAAAKERRNEVLQNLVNVHKLSEAQATKYAAQPVRLATTKPPTVRQGCANASTIVKNSGFFCQYVVDWLESTGGITQTQLNTGGLKIITTLDATKQNSIQKHLWTVMPSTAAMTAVMPVIDPKTGNILAMATNKRFGNPTSKKDKTHTSVSLFTQYTAAGASTYKLFSLLTALKIGVPSTWQMDTYNSNVNGVNGYSPKQCFNGGSSKPAVNSAESIAYTRNESLASATAKSSNTFYVGMDDTLFGCDLKPVVDMARSLGMSGLDRIDPNGRGKTTIAQDIISGQTVLQIALGSGLTTSPLELAGAYAAVANGGKFNAPAPVEKILDLNDKPLLVKRAPGVQVVSPQVAAQAAQILEGDTGPPSTGITYGTSYAQFQPWYAAHPGLAIAGKTGTAVASNESKNSALWFAGMTPNLAAVTGIFNPASSSQPITSLPNVPAGQASTTIASYASGVWLAALSPTLAGSPAWAWPDPASFASLGTVPNIVGQTTANAKKMLTNAGYKIQGLDGKNAECASNVTVGDVAFYGPTNAAPGATVTVCVSDGVAQTVYTPPPPKPPKPPKTKPRTHGGGGRGGGGGGGRVSHGPGH